MRGAARRLSAVAANTAYTADGVNYGILTSIVHGFTPTSLFEEGKGGGAPTPGNSRAKQRPQ